MGNKLELKVGDYVEFFGLTMTIYGCIMRINDDDSIDYVRESLTRWNASKSLVENGKLITEDNFISRVKNNAEKSHMKIPSTQEVKSVLEKLKLNFDIDMSEIHLLLSI